MKQPIAIVLVDDHTVVRQGLALLLSDARYGISVVGEAPDGREAIALVERLHPDVILMDLAMPGMSGLEATRTIKARHPQARILILTSLGDDRQALAAVRAGALGYVRKDSSADELVHAIQSVAMGRSSVPQELAAMMLTGEPGSRSTPDDPQLTPRELEVLGCLGQGMTDDEIASALAISKPTVRSHVSSILGKLGVSNRTQAVLEAQARGLLTG
jgi:NarL family two-component system response regulator LiaR